MPKLNKSAIFAASNGIRTVISSLSNRLHKRTKTVKMPTKAEKTRYSDQELEEFRVIIQTKLDRAQKEVDYYLQQLKEMADNPDAKVRGLDDGTNTMENERLHSMTARQQKLIKHLENALIRIQNKVYGVCRETGTLISKERLRAVPHATLSIKAKSGRKR